MKTRLKKFDELYVSLSVRIMIYVVLAFIISFFVYSCLRYSSSLIIDYQRRHDDRGENSQLLTVMDLQSYIQNHKIKSENISEINEWVRMNPFTIIYIYDRSKVWYTNDLTLNENQYDLKHRSQYPFHTRDIEFEDMSLSLDFLSLSYVQQKNNIFKINVTLSFLVFVFCLYALLHKITRTISNLTFELQDIGYSNRTKRLSVRGNDELTELALGINRMQDTIFIQTDAYLKSQETVKAITVDLSHDLRTPLTVLIGYLEILYKDTTLNKVQREYVRICFDKTQKLKVMSDDLFGSFSDIQDQELESLSIVRMDLLRLMTHKLSDIRIALDSQGFSVIAREFDYERSFISLGSTLVFERVFNNLVSNILKYADKREPIILNYHIQDNLLKITIRNKTQKNLKFDDQNGIGLRSCKRLLRLLQASIEFYGDDNFFNVTLIFRSIEK